MPFNIFTVTSDLHDINHDLCNNIDIDKLFIKNVIVKAYYIKSGDIIILDDIDSDQAESDELKISNGNYFDFYHIITSKNKMSNHTIKKLNKLINKIIEDMYTILKINIKNQEDLYPRYSLSNKLHYNKINDLLSRKINISKFNKISVIYFFIINNKNMNNCFICKIGFTENITNRIETLQNSYPGYKFHLIDLKEIDQQNSERQFNYNMRTTYPHLVIHKLEDINKIVREIYYFNDILLAEFNNYDVNNNLKYEYLMEVEKTKQNKEKTKQDQEKTKLELINLINEDKIKIDDALKFLKITN
jgi:hypothetical protein